MSRPGEALPVIRELDDSLAARIVEQMFERFEDRYLTDAEAAEFLQVSESTFRRAEFRARLFADGAKAYPINARGRGARVAYRWSRRGLLDLARSVGAASLPGKRGS